MIKTNLNWTVKNLKTMHDTKETLSFDHPIQRQSSQWDNKQQSLLIHSMLASFPVPTIYVEKRNMIETDEKGKHTYSYSVLDGKQRMTTTFSFVDGEFALAEDTPDVILDGVSYELSNKFFGELPEDIQQEILRFRFSITCFEDVTNEEIEEIFFRLNNSTPLSKPQKSRPLMGVSNSLFVNEILGSRFFKEKCSFSAKQLKNSDDMCTLLQSMMLLDVKYRGYEYVNISADSVMEYSRYIKNNYPEECKEKLKRIIGFLDNAFYMREKNLKKINIPMIVLMADTALERGIINSRFRSWFHDFFTYYKEEYGQYCSSGSIKKEKTEGRIRVMSESFSKFFEEKPVEETVSNAISTKVSIDETENETNDTLEESLLDSNKNETSLEENETATNEPLESSTDESSLENTKDSPATVEIEDLEESTDTTHSEVLETQTNEEYVNETTDTEISTDSIQSSDNDTEYESENETNDVSKSHNKKSGTKLGDLFDFKAFQTALAN